MLCLLVLAILSFVGTSQGYQCSNLTRPLNGCVRIINNTAATYQCNECWAINGDSRRNCTSEGLWTGIEPICASYCSNPILLHDGGDNIDAVGILGSSIVFFCRSPQIFTSQVLWYLNDSYINDSNDIMSDTSIVINEQIKALILQNISPNVNNSRIKCSAVYFEEYVYNSSESLLLVQGRLSSATDLNAKLQFNCTSGGSISIQWEPPSTLDIPQKENDLNFTVTLTYLEINETFRNILDTKIKLDIRDINPRNVNCVKFVVSVTSINDAGIGKSSNLTTFRIRQDPQLTVSGQTGMIIEEEQYMYNLTTTPAVCEIRINSGGNINFTVIEGPCGEESLIILNLQSRGLSKQIYSNTLFIGETGVELDFNISTFDIQMYNFSLPSPDLKTTVQIEYLKNSMAGGAMLIFLDDDSYIEYFQVISRDCNQTYNLASNSSNRISHIYDVNSNGYLDSNNTSPAVTFSKTPDIIFEEMNFKNCYIDCIQNITEIKCDCNYDETYQVILKDVSDSSGKIMVNATTCSNYVEFQTNQGSYSVLAFETNNNNGNLEYKTLYFDIMTKNNCSEGHNYGRKTCEYSSGLICSGVLISIIAMLHLRKLGEE